jgi:hypothetical protein
VLRILEQLDAELDAELDSGVAVGRVGSSSTGTHANANVNDHGDIRGDLQGGDAWGFVDSLRTLRLIKNADTWFIGKGSNGSVLWVRGDGDRYCCEPATARAIRTGTRKLSAVTLQKAAAAPGVNPRSGSELAWFAGYHASAVLAPWLSHGETYRLTRWPDFGRVQPDDSLLRAAQLRVLASLDAAPATIAQLRERTNASPEVIVRTLNALASCEFVEAATTTAQKTASPKSASPVPAGRLIEFLRNMRKHLGLWTSP